MFINLFILFIYLSIYLNIYLFIYLSRCLQSTLQVRSTNLNADLHKKIPQNKYLTAAIYFSSII